jgi:hypothetical protein
MRKIKKIVKKKTNILISGLILTSIIFLLLNTGPAKAFITNLEISENYIEQKEPIKINAIIQTHSNQDQEIDYFILKIEGPISFECKFKEDSTPIDNCPEISIIKTESTQNNYGYATINKTTKYNITIDSSYLCSGKYKTSILIKTQNTISRGSDIEYTILGTEQENPEQYTNSIRAKNGILKLNNQDYPNPFLSFYLPLNNAKNGEGAISAQKNRERIQYKFDTTKILRNNENFIEIQANGYYQINRNKKQEEESLICIDKRRNKVAITGPKINAINLDIYFKEYKD